jgi:hypothetical protein
MIELAWLWLRHQPVSSLSVWFRERVGERKGRIKRIAIVAMARKLLIALWRYLETGLVPEGAALKRKWKRRQRTKTIYRFQGGCVIGSARGCNTPRNRWVPSSLEPYALARCMRDLGTGLCCPDRI